MQIFVVGGSPCVEWGHKKKSIFAHFFAEINVVHLWDWGGTHETAKGGFFGRKNAKKLTFFDKKRQKNKNQKK